MTFSFLTTRRVHSALIAVTIAAVTAAACEDTKITNTTPTTLTTTVAFQSRIQPGAFAWRSFTVSRASTVTVQLVSIVPNATVGLALGEFDGTSCTPLTEVQTAPGADPQITLPATARDYCVRIRDIGGVTTLSDFTVSVVITPTT